jgi:hypothetical protein
MRKPRSDKKLEELTPDQRDALFAIVTRPGISVTKACELCKAEFGITTSRRAISVFRKEEIQLRERDRFLQASTTADSIVTAAADKLPLLTKGLKARLIEAAFQMQLSDKPAGMIKDVIDIVASIDRGDLERQRLALELEKFREGLKGDVERGLDALFAEVKGNAEAEALFQKLRAAVTASLEKAA